MCNARCFSRSVGEENHELLVQKERQSIAAASLVTALGNTDAAYIHEHLCDPSQPKQPTVRTGTQVAACALPARASFLPARGKLWRPGTLPPAHPPATISVAG